MIRTIRIKSGEVSLMEEGIIFAKAFPYTEMNLELAQEYHGVVSYLSEEQNHCTIADITGLAYMAKDAREWLKDNSNKWGKTISLALISNSFTAKMIGNLFITLSRPSYPSRLFSNYEEAYHWSKQNYQNYTAKTDIS